MFDFLLNKGAKTDLWDRMYPPALHVAVKQNHLAIMAKLFAAGVDWSIGVEHRCRKQSVSGTLLQPKSF